MCHLEGITKIIFVIKFLFFMVKLLALKIFKTILFHSAS